MKKNKLNVLLAKQLSEDRELLLEVYKDLREKTTTNQDFSVNGMTLAKFAELLTKQTAMIAEFYKTIAKEKQDDNDEMKENDIDEIYNEISTKN